MLAMVALELLTSGDPPASASQTAGITGVSHHVQPPREFLFPLLAPFLSLSLARARRLRERKS